MPVYTYVAADLRTGAVIDELPLVGVSFGGVLNGAGSLEGTVPWDAVNDSRTAAGILEATEPTRTVIWVDRDGTLVDGYIIWTRRQAKGGAGLELGCNGLWSYFRRRRLTSDLAVVATDQATIVKALLDHAQAKPGGNIRVAVPAQPTGALRDRTWWAFERKNIGEAVEQLADVINGFDFAVDATYVADVPVATFRVGYPRRGRTAQASGLLYEHPGNILSYDLAEDGTAAANAVSGLGQGDGETRLIVTQTDTSKIDAGYPLLEDVVNASDVKEAPTLDAQVLGQLSARAAPPSTWSVTVDASQDPVFGAWIVGDDCRIRITDRRFPDGLDTYQRIVAWKLTPGGGEAAETLELTLVPVAAAGARTIGPGGDAASAAVVERRLTTLESAPSADLMAVRDGAFVVLDEERRVRVRLGKQTDGTFGLDVFDDDGVKVARLGEVAPGMGRIGLHAFDQYGVAWVSAGQLTGGGYGLEQYDEDTGGTIPLSAIALGTQAGAVGYYSATDQPRWIDAGGPQALVNVPSTGKVEVHASVLFDLPADVTAYVGLSIDGAAAFDVMQAYSSGPAVIPGAHVDRIEGLTPGYHTFRLMYGAASGIAQFALRYILVRPY